MPNVMTYEAETYLMQVFARKRLIESHRRRRAALSARKWLARAGVPIDGVRVPDRLPDVYYKFMLTSVVMHGDCLMGNPEATWESSL